ncbi:MAG: transmembrane 220 family protein [Verrucomicrobiales bacterium]
MKIVNAIGVFLFVLFAWFQRNDIDPEIYYHASEIDSVLWFLFYLLIAGMFMMAIFRKVPIWLLALGVIACLVEMGLSGPGLWENVFGEAEFNMTQGGMSAGDPRVELSREFFGALIALVAVLFLWWQRKRSPEQS